ncbi:efflux RND transporter periplasmic adaptor subunit [Paenibacillus ehimensis]|uniref:efflux RND transporter periplasmic adaptor subunit n=1 Tax=Paenibacillus ehimensis TaxID=79264 RepID=UPI00047188D1|nr:efflux RND transporter periplasmic adaptor subunit [Paenibacillus ehimensis]
MRFIKIFFLPDMRGNLFSKKLGVVLLMVTTLLAGCSQGSLPSDAVVQAADPTDLKTVKTMKVAKQRWEGTKEMVAEVIPSQQLDVVLKTDGDVLNVVKKRGEQVNKDDVIVELDKKDILRQKQKLLYEQSSLQEQLSKAKKNFEDGRTELVYNIETAKQELTDTEKEYNTIRNNYDRGLADKKQVEQMESVVNKLRRGLEIMQKKLETLENTNSFAALQLQIQANEINLQDVERSMTYYDVKAPANGVLVEMPILEGMVLARGTKIGVVQQQSPIKIRAELTDTSLSHVQGKTELPFYIPDTPDKFTGKISYLANVANTQTKTYTLELEVPNEDGRLKSGMRVQLILAEDGQQETIAVPVSSIVREEGEAYVFVAHGDQVEKRKVKAGRTKKDQQEILNGLHVDETLVVTGQHQLKHNEKVKVVE